MASINGRDRISCKDSITGVKRFFLTQYKKIPRAEIVYTGSVVEDFPETILYKFDFETVASFTESMKEANGNISFSQTLSATFNKLSEFDNINFRKILEQDLFAVVELKNGRFLLMGFQNGVKAVSFERGDNQQYKIKFEATEEDFAPYIDDLIGSKLIVYDGTNAIMQDGNNLILNNNNNLIF